MLINFKEPTAPRYIYLNPENNRVHLMMPVVSGEQIGLDNTCKSLYALQEFFGKNSEAASKKQSALDEVKKYSQALCFDMALLPDGDELKIKKADRLEQLSAFRRALMRIENSNELSVISDGAYRVADYPVALKEIMNNGSNLFSMILRPKNTDPIIRSVNPAFSVIGDRYTEQHQTEVLYPILERALQGLINKLNMGTPKERLIQAVLDSQIDQIVDFKSIQSVLTEQFKRLFQLDVNFNNTHDGKEITKASMDALAPYPENITTDDYIDSLLYSCCPDALWESIPGNLFYTLENNAAGLDKLSILTQFFLAQINIHCVSNDLSEENFGKKLDGSSDLSHALAEKLVGTLMRQESVEKALCGFVNDHVEFFGLAAPLSLGDMQAIEQKFLTQFTIIKDSPHFDEFTLLDTSKPGKFVTHQGSICTDLSEFVAVAYPSLFNNFFQGAQADFNIISETNNRVIPHKNEIGERSIQLSLSSITANTFQTIFPNLSEQDQAEFLSVFNPKRMVSLIKDGIDLECIFRALPKQEIVGLINELSMSGIVSLISDWDDLYGVLMVLPKEHHFSFLDTLGIDRIALLNSYPGSLTSLLPLLPEKYGAALITTIGATHLMSMYKVDELHVLLQKFPVANQISLVQGLGSEVMASLITDIDRLIHVVRILSEEGQHAFISEFSIDRMISLIKSDNDLETIVSLLPLTLGESLSEGWKKSETYLTMQKENLLLRQSEIKSVLRGLKSEENNAMENNQIPRNS